jgi:uncharacterized membrane protein required for colicin V production
MGGLVAYVAALVVAVLYAPALAGHFARAFPVLADRLAAWLVGTAAGSNGVANPLTTSPLADLFGLGLPVGPLFGEWLSRGFLTVIAFLVLFLVVVALRRWVSALISEGFNRTPLGGLNRLAGFAVGGFIAALFLGLALSVVLFFAKLGGPAGVEGPFRAALEQSVLAPHLVQLFVWAAGQLKLLLTAP